MGWGFAFRAALVKQIRRGIPQQETGLLNDTICRAIVQSSVCVCMG